MQKLQPGLMVGLLIQSRIKSSQVGLIWVKSDRVGLSWVKSDRAVSNLVNFGLFCLSQVESGRDSS